MKLLIFDIDGTLTQTNEVDSVCFAKTIKAYSDNYFQRKDIISNAITQARQHYQVAFEDITYIGDRIWDYQASQDLNINFIGISSQFEGYHDKIPYVSDYYQINQYLDYKTL